MAQPYDRSAVVPAAGELDAESGQFWVGNAWQIVANEHNLSAFERNRSYLNLGDHGFADISYLCGTDSDGDGRSVIPADLNNDGMEDLVVRQAGGGPLQIFLNDFEPAHFLKVSLRAGTGNRRGLGARLVLESELGTQTRELYPANTFGCQLPDYAHFGLGKTAKVERLTVYWPSGKKQTLQPAINQHLLVEEPSTP